MIGPLDILELGFLRMEEYAGHGLGTPGRDHPVHGHPLRQALSMGPPPPRSQIQPAGSGPARHQSAAPSPRDIRYRAMKNSPPETPGKGVRHLRLVKTRMMRRAARHLTDHPSVLHSIAAITRAAAAALLVIVLPLRLIPWRRTLLEETANQHPGPFAAAVGAKKNSAPAEIDPALQAPTSGIRQQAPQVQGSTAPTRVFYSHSGDRPDLLHVIEVALIQAQSPTGPPAGGAVVVMVPAGATTLEKR